MYRGFLGIAGGLKFLYLGERITVHGGHEDLLRVGGVGRSARHHVGDHQSSQMPLIGQRVLNGEYPAP